MTPRDLFGLIVRLAGLATSLYAGYCITYAFADVFFGRSFVRTATLGNLINALYFGVAGLILLRAAEFITSLTYGPARNKGQCQHCGYDLRGSPDRCPECGKQPGPPAD